MAQVLLTRQEPVKVDFLRATAWRIRVTAESVDGSDPAVFLIRAHPADTRTGEQLTELESVCGPYDYSKYPVDNPTDETPFPFFRSSWFEIDVPTVEAGQEVWDFVVAEVNKLFVALDDLAQLSTVESVTVGTATGSESESS